MKKRWFALLLALALGVALAWSFRRWRAAQPKPTVAIQDGKTIDFSSGRPVVKDTPADKALIDSTVAEMNAAAKNVTFAPTARPPPAKKAPPPPAPPP